MDMSGEKEFITRKLGPLPMWAWMLIGLGAALAYKSWSANKKAAADKPTGQDNGTGVQLIGGNQEPPIVFQNYNTNINPGTPINVPPAGGRTGPPYHAPVATTPVLPTRPTPTPVTPVTPTLPAPAGPAAPAGQWVPVAKYTTHNPPWNSTLSGISAHLKGSASTAAWSAIWNAPQNAALRARRKQPNLIQAGDQIWVPA